MSKTFKCTLSCSIILPLSFKTSAWNGTKKTSYYVVFFSHPRKRQQSMAALALVKAGVGAGATTDAAAPPAATPVPHPARGAGATRWCLNRQQPY
jgi:hypothetical protein